MPPHWETAAALLAALNLWTFASFWHDKRQAIAGGRRISEGSLLLLALLGGTPGAFATRRMFRHKTRKQPFVTQLWLIALVQIGGLSGWISTAMPLPSAEALFQGRA